MSDRVDIGHDVVVWFEPYGTDEPRAGLEVEHDRPDGAGRCVGFIRLDVPATRTKFPPESLWQVQSWEPLTVSPSLLCGACGSHGWIRAGAWVPA